MKSLTWVHLSDIHFFSDKRPRFDQATVVRALARDICAVAQKIGNPDLILLTGDVAFSADPAQEYPTARAWLDKLLGDLGGLPASRVLIVPGNHDVDRGQIKANLSQRNQRDQIRAQKEQSGRALDEQMADKDCREQLWAKFKAYADFSNAYGNIRLESAHPFSVWTGAPLPENAQAIGLNTALISYDDDDRIHRLALGARQLDAVHQVPESELLLVLMHHPPEELHDRDKLLAVLADRPALLFSGHMHQLRTVQVETLGTSGHLHFQAGAGYAEHAGEHRYSWGRLDGKGLKVYPRRIDKESTKFVDDTRPNKITKRLSATLGQYYHQPLAKLPPRLQEWIKRQGSAPANQRLAVQPAILIARNQILEEHLLGDAVERLWSERLEHLNQLRRRRAFAEAKTVLAQLAADVALHLAAAADGPHALRMQQWSHRCQVTSASIHLAQDEPEIALKQCLAVYSAYLINPNCLRPKTRGGLANLLMDLNLMDEALKVLPDESELVSWDDEGKKSASLIRQAIEIRQDQFPEEYTDDELQLIASQKLLEAGDVTRAVTLAREVAERGATSNADNIDSKENALHVLMAALQATIWESSDVKQVLSFAERRRILSLIGEYVDNQDAASLDLWARRLAIGYFRITEQTSRGMALLNSLGAETPVMRTPSPPAGWVRDFVEIMKTAASTPASPALSSEMCQRLQQLAIRYPRRGPIDFELARCLLSLGRAEEALPHARAAFLVLPGIGQRIQLAQCLLLTRRFQRALDLVSSLSDQLPDVLQIRAKAMASLPKYMAAAVPLLLRYLERCQDDGGAWLGLAQAQARLGHHEEAAEAAWRAKEALSADVLGPDILVECAQLQFGSQQSARTRSRVEEAISNLTERFPGDPDAARGRLALLHRLGFPAQHRVDLGSLIKLGAVWEIPAEQGIAILREEALRAQHLHKLYQTGFLPFESFCELTNTPAARYLTHVLQSTAAKAGQLCPPLTYLTALTADRLRGAHLLCGALEVILLLNLGLFEALRKALGQGGKLILFEDVLERIQGDGLRLMREAKPRPNKAEAEEILLAAEERRLAVELQRTLEEGQRTGFIEFIPRPRTLTDLPPVRQQEDEDLFEAWVRVPLAKALAYHQSASLHPLRLLLTADLLTAEPFAPAVMIARALAWQTPDQFFHLRRQVIPDRVLSLSSLLRCLWGQNYSAQEELLALGFQDALDLRLLFHMSHKYRGLEQPRPRLCLDSIEWRAHQVDHVGQANARMQLSWAYGAAVWAAFCAPPDNLQPKPADCEALANTLLQRSERLDGLVAPPILLSALEHIASLSIQMLRTSIQESETGLQVSSDSPAGQMWRFLSLWAGPEGVRRGTLGLALAQAWLPLDRDEDPDAELRAMVLYVAVRSVQMTPQSVSTVAPEVEAVAILSANWNVKPLADLGLEDILREAALHLAQFKERPLEIPWDERSYHLPTPENATSLTLPVEAVVLRASEMVISWAAPLLALRQGLHDARAYDLLMKIAAAPSRVDLRRKYARLAVSAPWRQIRNAPTSIGTWTPWRVPQRFPRSLDDLRRMLGESVLDESEKSVINIIVHRTSWHGLPHGRHVLQLACEIPGALPIVSAQLRCDSMFLTEEVSLALMRLGQSNDQSAGRLCSEIIFLCRAAEEQVVRSLPDGAGNLREILPRRFTEVLETVLSPPPADSKEPSSLADAEYALVRLCSWKISDLAGLSAIPMREGLWLCYRLYQWLILQLDRMRPSERSHSLKVLSSLAPPEAARADLLHPLHCARGKIDLRLMSVLQGLNLGIQLARSRRQHDSYLPLLLDLEEIPASIPWEPSSPELEGLLVDIASRELTEAERSMRPLALEPSCLDWNGPGAAPDLALAVLLMLTHGRGWLRLQKTVRIGWIAQIPSILEDKGSVNRSLALAIIDALGDLCRSVSVDEQNALLSRLQSMQNTEESSHWRLTFYSALFASGRAELEEEVEMLLKRHIGHTGGPAFFGRYLTGISTTKDGSQLEKNARELVSLAAPEHKVPLLWGIGYLVLHGASEASSVAESLLHELAGVPPWRDDQRTRQLLDLVATNKTGG